jgi:hypothetical protein
VYCENDPINFVDPWGLKRVKCISIPTRIVQRRENKPYATFDYETFGEKGQEKWYDSYYEIYYDRYKVNLDGFTYVDTGKWIVMSPFPWVDAGNSGRFRDRKSVV